MDNETQRMRKNPRYRGVQSKVRGKEPYTHVLKIKESYTPPKNSDNTYKFIARLGLVVRIREKS